MYLQNAMAAGLDYETAMDMPFCVVADLIAAAQLMGGGFRRVYPAGDEFDFMQTFGLR